MLEPYQPKFQQQHRTSCPMGESVLSPQVSVKSESEKLVKRMKHAPSLAHSRENGQRMSFSKYNVNCMGDPAYTALQSPNPLYRQRQNSVFVGSSTMAVMNPPRRVKSAIDIQHMVLSDYSPGSLSGCSSLLPMYTKRPSITVEKPSARHRRQSMLDAPQFTRLRRPSVLPPRHRHFISFDQPSTSWDRRTSVSVERPRRQQRSLEEQPALVVEPPSEAAELVIVENRGAIPKTGSQRSCPESMVCLHQPRRPSFHLDMPGSPGRHRLSVSLDNPAMGPRAPSTERRNSSYSSFDETQIKLSNLEYSKVSDV